MRDAKTPWTAEPSAGRGSWIKNAEGKWVALSCGEDDKGAEANAETITASVNNLAALVLVLKRIASRQMEDGQKLSIVCAANLAKNVLKEIGEV